MSIAAGNLEKLDVDFLAINAAFADRKLIRRAQNIGKEVYVWTSKRCSYDVSYDQSRKSTEY